MSDTEKRNLLKRQINFTTSSVKHVFEKLVEQCCEEIFKFEQQQQNNYES